jgi:ELWxxDGT repeat protein
MQIISRAIDKFLAVTVVGLSGLFAPNALAASTFAGSIDPGDQGSGAIATIRIPNPGGGTYFIVGEGDPGLWSNTGYWGATTKIKGFETSGSNIAEIGKTMYFACDLGDGAGEEVCKSNGTTAGTVRVADINAGLNDSRPDNFVAFNGAMYFTANDGANGREVWMTTGSGASIVANINPQAGQGSNPIGLTVHNGHLVLSANDGTNGTELMRISPSSVVTAVSALPGNFSPSDLVSVGADLYGRGTFGGQNVDGQSIDIEPFRVGANWAVSKYDLATGSASSYPSDLYAWNGAVYLSARGSAGDELFFLTPTGSAQIADINPGTASSKPSGFQVINQKLVFAASTAADGRELWSWPGAGLPTRISQIGAGALSGNPIGMTNTGTGAIYFAATDGGENFELWRTTNGTSVSFVKEISPGADGSMPIGFVATDVADVLFFANDNGTGDEPWVTTGSAPGTVQAKNINTAPNGEAGNGVTLGAWTYFPAYAKNSGTELHRTDGVTTQLVAELQPGVGSSNPSNLTVAGGWVYFAATVNDVSKLWRTNGVTTEIATNLNAIGASDAVGNVVATASGEVYFSANGPSGSGLYKLGVGLVKAGEISEVAAQGSEVWFNVGANPHKVVGGAVSAIGGVAVFYPSNYTRAANGDVYFVASAVATGSEVYRVPAGTASATLLKDVNPGAGSSNAAKLTTIDNTLFFAAWNGTRLLMYRSDGTTANTGPLQDEFASWNHPTGTLTETFPVAGKEYLDYPDYTNLIKVESPAGKSIYMPGAYANKAPIGPYVDGANGNGTNCISAYGASTPGRTVLQAFANNGVAPFTWNDSAYAWPGTGLWGSSSGAGLGFSYFFSGVNGLMSVEYGPQCYAPNSGNPFYYRAAMPDSRIGTFEDVVLGSANGRVYIAGWKENNGGYEVWSMAHAESFTRRLNANGMQDQRIMQYEGKFNVDRGTLKFQPAPTMMLMQGYDPAAKQQKRWKLQ